MSYCFFEIWLDACQFCYGSISELSIGFGRSMKILQEKVLYHYIGYDVICFGKGHFCYYYILVSIWAVAWVKCHETHDNQRINDGILKWMRQSTLIVLFAQLKCARLIMRSDHDNAFELEFKLNVIWQIKCFFDNTCTMKRMHFINRKTWSSRFPTNGNSLTHES